jgi:phosphoribosylformylglycinamidine synthase II
MADKRYRVVISRQADTRGNFIKDSFQNFGLSTVENVIVSDVYYITGDLSADQLHSIAQNVLCDPVIECYVVDDTDVDKGGIEILYNPGVTDPKEASVRKAIADIGLAVHSVKTGSYYVIEGDYDRDELIARAALFLYNPLVQHVRHGDVEAYNPTAYKLKLVHIDLTGDLLELSRNMGLSLNRNEMAVVKDYFAGENREPTDVELEAIAQTWSEHCRHKTFLGKIDFDGEIIDNLLRQTIMKATREIAHPLCLSVFHDNSGVIDFDEKYGVCFKVETHNHPSALEPYGGAATGIGGVIRDILGTGLGARPIMSTDIFCFGLPGFDFHKLPTGILHPSTIMKGVIRGVRDYGNRMGIPTASGAIYFDEDFLYNPLVYCGCIGLIRKDRIKKGARPGDAILLVGGRTGRDGIHGVTFASAELSGESEKSCVQIGNPIVEKRVTDCLLKVSEEGILSSVTDCGGGGLSSAVGEMGKETGVVVYLDRVPLKYQGLSPREIWISESQERMILAVAQNHLDRVLTIFGQEGVEATVIGEFTNDRRLALYYGEARVCDLDMQFLHDGLPMPTKRAKTRTRVTHQTSLPKPIDFNSLVLEIVGSLNSCSREWVIREYDHEVQGASVIKSLVGTSGIGPQDAVVIRPRLDRKRGVVVSCGINPSFGRFDAYNMALSVVDEALRNLVAAGGDIRQAAMLDNFCLSSPEREDVLADLVLSARGCYDAAKYFGVPFISGKDSLYNEWMDESGEIFTIPPTLLISAIGIIENVDRCVSMDLKAAGHDIFIIGETRDEMGGSEYYRLMGMDGGTVPGLDFQSASAIMQRLHLAINSGLVLACHDLSEGGLALAIAEMAFSGNVGVEIDIGAVPHAGMKIRHDALLFSESNTRFLVEVKKENSDDLMHLFKALPAACIGHTTNEDRLRIFYGDRKLADLPLVLVRKKWQRKIV